MRFTTYGGIFLALVAVLSMAAAGHATTLTAGELSVTLDDQARVTGMSIGTTDLQVTPAPLVSLLEAGDDQFMPASVSGSPEAGLRLDFAEAQLQGTLDIGAEGEALRFSCRLQGADLPARGMLLRFAFPFDATGWQWHDDMQGSVRVDGNQVYENVVPLRAYADLPEWAGEPSLRMGYSSRNFCTVLTGPVGLALAVPVDRPCIFRTAYDGAARQLQILYDFALSPDTKPANQVELAFYLYPVDPHWGFRSALARYYRMHPEMFEVHAPDQGQWVAFSKLSEIDNVNEFYIGLQEGASEPEYDNRVGAISCPYFTHAGMGARIPDYDPESDPLPEHPVLVQAMEAAFKNRTGVDGMFAQVGLHDAEGKLDVRKWRVYAHLIAQFNLSPQLPYGEWTLQRAIDRIEEVRRTRNAELGGFYYDGLSSGINYRTDHFVTHQAPPIWDPVAGKPFINNFFSSCEFARAAAELLRPRGLITMMNGAMGASFYVAPWLDVLGAETGLRISRSNLNYIRTISHQKPFMTLLKGNYEQNIGGPEVELFHKRCLAYGIFPGFFDWSPSGLGPGGRYWAHPRYYERDRDTHRKYQPLARAVAMAGWEPVTFARSSEPSVFVERYGPCEQGIVWLTLLNEEAQPQQTRLTIDASALGLNTATVQAMDMVSGTPVQLQRNGAVLAADLEVAADGVMAIQLADPQLAAAWRVQEARKTLDQGMLMREVDRDKPPLLVHWLPSGAAYSRETVDDDIALVFDAADRTAQSASQWVMLFQPAPTELTLRARVAGENLSGDSGSIGISCRLARVTSSFTHYETQFFDLPTGTYDWQDVEFAISSEHALRSIQMTLTRGANASGTLKLASVSLSDANRDQYIVDSGFSEWYEPLPEALRPTVEQRCSAIGQALESLEAATAQLTSQATQQAVLDLFGQTGSLRRTVLEAGAENGCRRVLRDLETIEQHLGFVTLSAFGVQPPAISGSTIAAPGDVVQLAFSAPTIAGLPVSAELQSPQVSITRAATGGSLTVPADAQVGSVIGVEGLLRIGPEGRSALLRASHQIAVMAALEMTLESQGSDADTGACRLGVTLRNNRQAEVTARLQVTAPEGWSADSPASVSLPASGQATVEAQLRPPAGTPGGPVEVSVSATTVGVETQERLTMLYIPPEANLVRNPGFEDGATGWGMTADTCNIDTTVSRSGQASVRLHNPTPLQTTVSQGITLNQQHPCAILVRASSKAENVSGALGRGYSLYVDIYYTDGTPLWGRTYDFQTGTSDDWQTGELYIEPEKPIRNVNVYLLLRGKSGTVWFDDVAVMEDPMRKGNIARDAQVTVDSSYSGYDARPINDGRIRVEGLHWTEQAWASAENEQPKFIDFSFDQAHSIGRAGIYWSLDSGIARTSQEVLVQVPDGDQWRTIITVTPPEPVPYTVIELPEPVTTDRIRLYQPPQKGPVDRTGLMWVREVELSAP